MGLGVRAVVHGEDFMIGGTAVALDVVDRIQAARAQGASGAVEEEASGRRLERTLRWRAKPELARAFPAHGDLQGRRGLRRQRLGQ